MTIKIDLTAHIHTDDHTDRDELRQLDEKVSRAILLIQQLFEVVVKDPAKVAELVEQVDSAAERLKEAAVKSVT